MKYAYIMTTDDYLAIIEMAKKNGKKPGDSLEEEFKEYIKNNPNKVKSIGKVHPDILKRQLQEKENLNILDLRNDI